MAAHHQASINVPDRKPLYLLACTGAHIEAGADHLLLRRDSSPTQRFPTSRIARIICNAQTLWSGQALALCFAKGISITWIDGHGHALGSAQASHPSPLPMATLLESYLELPDWPQRFENWLIHRRLDILQECVRRAAANQRPLPARVFHELKRQFVHNGQHPLAFEAEGEGFCHAHVVDQLQQAGLHAIYWGFDAQALDLAAQLASLMWAELNLECGTLPAQAEHGALAAHLFETWSRQREARLHHHVCDLKRHLARELDTWH